MEKSTMERRENNDVLLAKFRKNQPEPGKSDELKDNRKMDNVKAVSALLATVAEGKTFDRAEAAKIIGKTAKTTNRILERMVRSKLLRRLSDESAKSVRYVYAAGKHPIFTAR